MIVLFPQVGALRWLLFLIVASSFKSSDGKRWNSGRGYLSKIGNDLSTTGRFFINIFEGTSNETAPHKLITYHPEPKYDGRHFMPKTWDPNRTQPTPAPPRSRIHKLLREVFGLPLKITRKLFAMFWFLAKFPFWVAGKLNEVVDRFMSKKTRQYISWFQVKFLTYLARIVTFNLKIVSKFVRWVHGDLCIVFPDIPHILEIFSMKGGKICPFAWFDLGTVEVRNSEDGQYWAVNFPFQFHDVDMIFATVSMETPFGLPEPSVGGFNLTAGDVMVNFTMFFTKDIFPMLVPLKSIGDTKIQVEGCTGAQPGAWSVTNLLTKWVMKLCDPVLNEILKVMLFTGKVNMELVHWFFNKFIKGAEWVGHLITWLVTKVEDIF